MNEKKKLSIALAISIFLAGACSIVYELLISIASSYFIGDSIVQFSLTIGFYLAAMGIGSYYSRYITRHIIVIFIGIELLLAAVGGMSVPILYLVFIQSPSYYQGFMLAWVVLIGSLIGCEIPLLTYLLEKKYHLRITISHVLSLDYAGALVATILLPFLLLPFFGVFRSSLIIGLCNMVIVYICYRYVARPLRFRHKRWIIVVGWIISLVLFITCIASVWLLQQWDTRFFRAGEVVVHEKSPYQNIHVIQRKNEVRLYLNGNLQFSSVDEYRYHESLVHYPLLYAPHAQNALVLGGGDGLAARELLKYPNMNITLVDLDEAVTRIAKKIPIRAINYDSLENKRVHIIHKDAWQFLYNEKQQYDIIIMDFPDPSTVELARLYSREFYELVRMRLHDTGVMVTQASNVLLANESFWSIVHTVNAVFSAVIPYHVEIPSFGQWGFVLAMKQMPQLIRSQIPVETQFLTTNILFSLYTFPKDIQYSGDPLVVSTLDRPITLQLYLSAFNRYR